MLYLLSPFLVIAHLILGCSIQLLASSKVSVYVGSVRCLLFLLAGFAFQVQREARTQKSCTHWALPTVSPHKARLNHTTLNANRKGSYKGKGAAA